MERMRREKRLPARRRVRARSMTWGRGLMGVRSTAGRTTGVRDRVMKRARTRAMNRRIGVRKVKRVRSRRMRRWQDKGRWRRAVKMRWRERL
jgi:hypothetical protein